MAEIDIMTIEQVAKYLKLKPQTIYKWAQEGSIPAAKIGKEWRFRKRIIDEWIDSSINLSDAGFDLMLNRSWLQIKNTAIKGNEIDEMIRNRWEDSNGGKS